MINNLTQLNMIIGNPLKHSLTPILHNTVYKLLNLNSVMLAHPTENLVSTIHAMKFLAVGCIAVTMPYKQEILPYLDHLSEEVKTLQSANTVIVRAGELFGFNTDIDGIAYALREIVLENKNVLLIGAGGAAHAAAYYLQLHEANIFYFNRTHNKTMQLINLFGGNTIDILTLQNLPIDVIINATPVGMFPTIELSPLPSYQFHSHQIVFDMIYNPIETVLIKTAKLQGATCLSGLEMFIAQGLKQIELWANKIFNKDDIIPLVKKELALALKIEEIL